MKDEVRVEVQEKSVCFEDLLSVDRTGVEPVTSTMPLWRSPKLS